MGVETCGDCWTVEESVLIFIYTPVIFISLASNPSAQNRPILPAIVIPSPTIAHLVPYLLLFCLIMSGFQRGGRIGCACLSGWKIRVA